MKKGYDVTIIAFFLKSATTLKNDIELKEKRFDEEKDAQSGGNRHKVA